MEDEYIIRRIESKDNEVMASIIRAVLPEFRAVESGGGSALDDPEVDNLYEAYADAATSAYFVIEHTRSSPPQVLGGGGLAQLEGGSETTCELRKLYFLPALRGLGLGKRLLEKCITTGRQLGFQHMYIETFSEMKSAIHLYEAMGAKLLSAPLGATGHHACDKLYLIAL